MGEVSVVGVCIPWFESRTEASRKVESKCRGEDHEQYLAGLTEVLGQVLILTGSATTALSLWRLSPETITVSTLTSRRVMGCGSAGPRLQ